MEDFNTALQEASLLLNEKLDKILPEPEYGKDSRLIEAMRYATLNGGKRLRPFLTIVASDIFGVSRNAALQAAAAIELIHTYSLIHDDLPAMDNDDLRRGKPSCHIKFGESTAILAGDALLTIAFEILADPATHADSNVRCELISSIAKAIGVHGMVGGQVLDLLAEEQDLTINEIIRMQRMKTSELFMVACEAGAILGKASKNLRLALKGYAHAIGLAFQIMDDLADIVELAEKKQEIDMNNKKFKGNYVRVVGVEQSKQQASMLINQAITHLSLFDKRANLLRDLANYVASDKINNL